MDHRAKLAQARKHLDTLDNEIVLFDKSDPYSAGTYYDAKDEGYIARIHVSRDLPPEWSLIVGDMLHNMRSALDNLAYALVVAHSGKPTEQEARNIQFLVCDGPGEFKDRCARYLGKMSTGTQATIEGLQPYNAVTPGYRHPLSVVRDLSNVDKHRHIILTRATAEMSSIVLEGPGLPPGTTVVGFQGPFEEGTEIARWKYVGGPPYNPEVKMTGYLAVVIAFARGWPAFGGSVPLFLKHACDHIETVVFAKLEPFL